MPNFNSPLGRPGRARLSNFVKSVHFAESDPIGELVREIASIALVAGASSSATCRVFDPQPSTFRGKRTTRRPRSSKPGFAMARPAEISRTRSLSPQLCWGD